MPRRLLQAYEERFLFLLLLLRQPRARLIYVTSQAIHPSVIDYYLDLLPGVIPSHARPRLLPRLAARRLVAAADAEAARAAAAARAHPRAHPRSRPRAPRAVQHDGARARPRARARHPDVRRRSPVLPARDEERLPAPLRRGGRAPPARHREPVHDRASWRRDRRAARGAPAIAQVIVKLNEGVSGEGNALVDLDGLERRGRTRRRSTSGCATMRFELPETRTRLRRQARGARRRRRGADRRRRVPQPERAAPRHAARRGRAALDARPAARRAERPDVPRLHLPGRPRVRAGDHARGGEGRRAAGDARA